MASERRSETEMVAVPREIMETAAGVVGYIEEVRRDMEVVRSDMDSIEDKLGQIEQALKPIQPYLDGLSQRTLLSD